MQSRSGGQLTPPGLKNSAFRSSIDNLIFFEFNFISPDCLII
jgi:hypothetical protein